MAAISENSNSRQKVLLDFVLSYYVAAGVAELDQTKRRPLLKLNYHDPPVNAVAALGEPEEIRKPFSEFQRYLDVEAST